MTYILEPSLDAHLERVALEREARKRAEREARAESPGGIALDSSTNDAAAPASDAHYRYEYQGVKLDPYRILQVYDITHPAHQHAIKKLLRAGRSIKDTRRDVAEVILALQRWLEMMDEDMPPAPPK